MIRVCFSYHISTGLSSSQRQTLDIKMKKCAIMPQEKQERAFV